MLFFINVHQLCIPITTKQSTLFSNLFRLLQLRLEMVTFQFYFTHISHPTTDRSYYDHREIDHSTRFAAAPPWFDDALDFSNGCFIYLVIVALYNQGNWNCEISFISSLSVEKTAVCSAILTSCEIEMCFLARDGKSHQSLTIRFYREERLRILAKTFVCDHLLTADIVAKSHHSFSSGAQLLPITV